MPQMNEWGDAEIAAPSAKPNEWGDAPVQAPAAQSRSAYPDDPVSTAMFQQSPANKLANAATGNWFTRPFQASAEAIKNSFTSGGLSDSSVEALANVGKMEDFKNQQSEWQHTVNGALIMPSAAMVTAGKVAADYAMRTANAVFSGGLAVAGGFVNEATGAMGLGRTNPEAVARDADNDAQALYLMAGMSEASVPLAGAGPSLKEAMSLPGKVEKVEGTAVGEAVAETPKPMPVLKAPVQNPMIDEASGNLNLKYIKTNEDVQGILARSAQAIADRDGVVISNSITKAKGQALVDQALTESANGIPSELANRMRGDPTNEAQLYAARLLVKQTGEEVYKLGQIAQKTNDERDYAALEDSYDRLMSINGIRHDISATIGRASQSHQIVIGGEEAAQVLTGISKEDAMRTAMNLPNEQAVAKMAQTMKKPGWGDMVIFHYVSCLLSNPVSHGAYAIAGEVQAAIRAGIESPLASGVGAIRRAAGYALSPEEFSVLQKEREGIESKLAASNAGTLKLKAGDSGQMEIRLKEIVKQQKQGESHMPAEIAGRLFGLGKGQVDGLRAAGRSIVSGNTQMFPGEEAAAQAAREQAMKEALEEGKTEKEAAKAGDAAYGKSAVRISNPIMERAQYINNPLFKSMVEGYGRIVGISPTVASSIHTFQKFSAYTESLYAIAYRHAALMGEADNATMGARVAHIISNPTEDMMREAAENGKYASLVNKPGALGQSVENFAHTNNWTRFIVPFARVSTNLTSQTLLERTPAGLLSAEIRARLSGARGGIAQEDAIARMSLGTGVVSIGAWLAAKGVVNGVGPSQPSARAENYMTGRPPLSIRIGNHAYPLRLFGVPGRIISYGAASHDVFQDGKNGDDLWDAMGHMTHTVAETVLQENALKGLADFLDAAVGHDAEMSKRYALNAVGTMAVPRGIAQITRMEDPYMRSTMGNGFMDRLYKTLDAQLPWKSASLLPQVDVYGRDMRRNVNYEEAMKDPVTQAELRTQQYPTRVETRINNVKLNDQQYYEYQKKAGVLYYDNMQRMVSDSSFAELPVDTQKDMIHSAMVKARALARQDMMLNDPALADEVEEYHRKLIEKKIRE